MDFGSYSIHVAVEGPSGSGKAVVPVMSVATSRLGIDWGLGLLLSALGLVLFAGALTILGAAAREAVLPPDEVPDAARRARGRRVIAGSRWSLRLRSWGEDLVERVDARYRESMFRPLHIITGVRADARSACSAGNRDPEWLGQEPTPAPVQSADAGSRQADAHVPGARAGPRRLRTPPPTAP